MSLLDLSRSVIAKPLRTLGRMVVLADRDDDPAAAVLAQELTTAGGEVAVTSSAEAAAVSIQEESVATLVVAREDLPLVTALRGAASRRQRTVSVIALLDTADGADAALAAGADAVLIRPVELDRLVEALTRLA